jgi:hypothetical protein
MKKFSAILILIISIFSTPSFSGVSQYFGSSKTTNLKLDETGVVNFLRYLEGRFFSENNIIDRSARGLSPSVYAISQDGKIAYGWFCYSDNCGEFLPYKTVEYCKEYTGQNCFIFAIKNKIVWDNLDIVVTEKSFSKNVELIKKLNLYDLKSKNIVNEENYKKYVLLDDDECNKKKNHKDLANLRGASLFCMLPGRYHSPHNKTSVKFY